MAGTWIEHCVKIWWNEVKESVLFKKAKEWKDIPLK
jgi:hypothetical protein